MKQLFTIVKGCLQIFLLLYSSPMNTEQKKTAKAAIEKALSITGSPTRLAAVITLYKPCSRQLAHQWRIRGAIGPGYVQAAVKAFKGDIAAHEFRPDIFKKEVGDE